MSKTPTPPVERAEADSRHRARRDKQPYAAELDDRELEHAHQDKRPLDPKGKATAGEAKPR